MILCRVQSKHFAS